jgi:hypothetical protein
LKEVLASNDGKVYALYGVVVHSGPTADSGHYFSFARESDAPDLWQKDSSISPWILFNDHKVSRSSFTDIRNVTKQSAMDSAYILFYKDLSISRDTIDPEFSRISSISVCHDRIFNSNFSIENDSALYAANRTHYSGLSDLNSWFTRKYLCQRYGQVLPEFDFTSSSSTKNASFVASQYKSLVSVSLESTKWVDLHCNLCLQLFASKELVDQHQLSCPYAQIVPRKCSFCHRMFLTKDIESHQIACGKVYESLYPDQKHEDPTSVLLSLKSATTNT